MTGIVPKLFPNFAPRFVLNQRVEEGRIKPVFDTGDRLYSGFVITGLLGWPLSDGPQGYIPRSAQAAALAGPAGDHRQPAPRWMLNSAAGRSGCSLVSRLPQAGTLLSDPLAVLLLGVDYGRLFNWVPRLTCRLNIRRIPTLCCTIEKPPPVVRSLLTSTPPRRGLLLWAFLDYFPSVPKDPGWLLFISEFNGTGAACALFVGSSWRLLTPVGDNRSACLRR